MLACVTLTFLFTIPITWFYVWYCPSRCQLPIKMTYQLHTSEPGIGTQELHPKPLERSFGADWKQHSGPWKRRLSVAFDTPSTRCTAGIVSITSTFTESNSRTRSIWTLSCPKSNHSAGRHARSSLPTVHSPKFILWNRRQAPTMPEPCRILLTMWVCLILLSVTLPPSKPVSTLM
jgi:hypothetical protein